MLAFANVLSHFKQLKGFSSVWILSWVFILLAGANVLSHFEQLNGFLSEWILTWVFKLLACADECLGTLGTVEWFLMSVDSYMGLQIACRGK